MPYKLLLEGMQVIDQNYGLKCIWKMNGEKNIDIVGRINSASPYTVADTEP